VELLGRLFTPAPALARSRGNTIHHGTLRSVGGDLLDEVMVAVYRAPASYTGEEAAEIFGHGSPAGVRRILDALLEVGFAPASPGEFTRRAFQNGKLDLTRAEAINDVVRAQTIAAHRYALDRLTGTVERAVNAVREELVAMMARLAIQLDYPEDETGPVELDAATLEACGSRLDDLASTYRHGRLVQDGASVALAGRTNAGKSSLFNLLLRQDRTIVSEIPGTTRDYVETLVDIRGIPIRLYDTAGLRPAGEPVEEEGIRRSRAVIAAADLVLYVLDSTEGYTEEDRRRVEEITGQTPAVLVWNKTDLEAGVPPADACAVSALTGSGLAELEQAIAAAVDDAAAGDGRAKGHDAGRPVIDSARQHALLLRARDALARARAGLAAGQPADMLAEELQDAVSAVGEITGHVTTDEILDVMFSSFCVGK
jgi:tRNA modification GTPase